MKNSTNNTLSIFAIISITFFLIGCTHIQNITSAPQAIWPWNDSNGNTDDNQKILKILCSSDNDTNQISCSENDALAAFYNASKYCRSVHNFYERGGKRAFATKTGIGLVGTISAIIMAPLSSGNAAKAWTGVSGVANAAQTSLDEELEKTITSRRRAYIDKAAKEGETKFFDNSASSPAMRIAIAIQTARSCATASAQADESALAALAKSQPDSLAPN